MEFGTGIVNSYRDRIYDQAKNEVDRFEGSREGRGDLKSRGFSFLKGMASEFGYRLERIPMIFLLALTFSVTTVVVVGIGFKVSFKSDRHSERFENSEKKIIDFWKNQAKLAVEVLSGVISPALLDFTLSKAEILYTERLNNSFDPSQNNNALIKALSKAGDKEAVLVLLCDQKVNPQNADEYKKIQKEIYLISISEEQYKETFRNNANNSIKNGNVEVLKIAIASGYEVKSLDIRTVINSDSKSKEITLKVLLSNPGLKIDKEYYQVMKTVEDMKLKAETNGWGSDTEFHKIFELLSNDPRVDLKEYEDSKNQNCSSI